MLVKAIRANAVMARQLILMRKYTIGIISCILLLFCVSCTRDIPEGDIKDFVDKLNFETAYQNVSSGKSIVIATYYIDDVEDGKISTTTYFDKKDLKYHYITTDVTGSYFGTEAGQFAYHNQQILCYMLDNETASVYKKTDGELEDISYRPEDVNTSIHNFFYSELEAGYHRGGVYYGDYIVANCAKFYSCFSLNEDKSELTYKVNTSTHNSEGDEVVTMHNFTVNEFGMILTLSSKSIIIEKNIVIETTIACEYDIVFDKLESL